MERLKDLSGEEIDKANERLKILCEKYDFKPIDIRGGKGSYKELVFRMIGIDPIKGKNKKVGRPSRTNKDAYAMYRNIQTIQLMFGMKKKEAIEKYIKDEGLKDEVYEDSNKIRSIRKVIRGVIYNRKKLEEAEKEYYEELNKYDWP